MNNRLTPESPDLTGIFCPRVDDPQMIRERYNQYTTDESRLHGSYPERIYFPRMTLEVASALAEIAQRQERLTISGARTGIAGGAAPQDSTNLLCLETLIFEPRLRADENHREWTATVATGMTLEQF